MRDFAKKKFSKKFKSQTIFNDNGFVYYRRRDLKDNFVMKNDIQLITDMLFHIKGNSYCDTMPI